MDTWCTQLTLFWRCWLDGHKWDSSLREAIITFCVCLYGIMYFSKLKKRKLCHDGVCIQVAISLGFSIDIKGFFFPHKLCKSSLHAIGTKQMLPKPQNNLVVIFGFLCNNKRTNNLDDKANYEQPSHSLLYYETYVFVWTKFSVLDHNSLSKNVCKKVMHGKRVTPPTLPSISPSLKHYKQVWHIYILTTTSL